MGREISDLEQRLARLKDAAVPAAAAAVAGIAAGVAVARGRKRGRPPGRPPGRPGRPPGRPPGSGAAAGAGKRGRKASTPITAEQLASRKLQGVYLAHVRRFPKAKRAQYKAIAKEKGREAAIKEMQNDLKK